MGEAAGPNRQIQSAVFWISCALILVEVSFTRLLAYKLYYHYVFFGISLALLGLGGAGTYVTVRSRPRSLEESIYRWIVALIISVPVVLECLNVPFLFLPLDSSLAKIGGKATLAYLICAAPMIVWLHFCGGVVLASAFSEYGQWIGKLYARDLAGTAIGCVACILLMKYASPPVAFLVAGICAFVAWIPLHLRLRAPARSRRTEVAIVSAGLLFFVVFAFGPDMFRGFHGRVSDGKLVKYEWNHLFRTDHRDGSYVLDADASTPVVQWNAASRNEQVWDPTYGIAKRGPRVAVIGSGGGLQVAEALRAGASEVFAIDINPTINRWVMQEDRGVNGGLFLDPRVELVTGEGRHTLRSAGRQFDVIVMHAIDTYSATASGAYALTENFLYTKEAFKDYFQVLSERGIMSISRWLFNPPRENLRIFATLLEVMEEMGIQKPTDHLVMIAPVPDYAKMEKNRVYGYLLFAKAPLSNEQVRALRAHVGRMQWSTLYAPGVRTGTAFDTYAHAADRRALEASYPYLIGPVSDSRPYLFQFYSPLRRVTYRTETGMTTLSIYQSSATILAVTLVVTTCLSVAIILSPLWFSARRQGTQRDVGESILSLRQVLYFTGLGIGFMAFEVPLVQILSLYLGHPTYGFAVVLVALLLFASIGSLMVDRVRYHQSYVCLAIAGVLIAVALTLFQLVHATIDWPEAGRFALALGLVSICAVPMGFPLAMGIRGLVNKERRVIAWAWAVNSSTSVVGSCLVMVVMVYGGSGPALAIGVVCYLLSALSGWRWETRSAG